VSWLIRTAVFALLSVLLAVTAGGEPLAVERSLPEHLQQGGIKPIGAGGAAAVPPEYEGRLADIWGEGDRLERAGALHESVQFFDALVKERPDISAAYWRSARAYWRIADALPRAENDRRIEYFDLADTRAREGIEADPECAACMLWKYAALGGLSMTKGFMWGARHAREMMGLLDRGIALRPSYRDDEKNSTLANLYYARAVFRRMVPDWFWLSWVIGVRGDTELALLDIENAIALSADRVDYQVELGAILLCQGKRKKQPQRVEEGVEALRYALTIPTYLRSDRIERHYARILMNQPEKACAYSGEGFIDVNKIKRSDLVRAK
jgi:tetratricopeptide (TPR) repeat protein